MAQAGLIFPSDSAFAHLSLSPRAKLFAVQDDTSPALNGWVTIGDITDASYAAAARLVQVEAIARGAALDGVVQAAAASAIASVLAAVQANVTQLVQQTVANLPPPALPPVQIPFVVVGRPGAGQTITVPMALRVSMPANLAGLVVYFAAVATADAVFQLIRISGATKTPIGTITVTAGSHAGFVASLQAAMPVAIGDALQIVCPAVQDATLASGGITFLAART